MNHALLFIQKPHQWQNVFTKDFKYNHQQSQLDP